MNNHLFCFGFGYCAQALAKELVKDGFDICATIRDAGKIDNLKNQNVTPYLLPLNIDEIPNNSYILLSAAPNENGDIFFQKYADELIKIKDRIKWIGYLSTIAVYGDNGDETINEDSSLQPSLKRAQNRVIAEQQWQSLAAFGMAVNVFRLGGIYGNGRSVFDKIKDETAKIIVDNDKLTCRIHVDDIAGIIKASIKKQDCGQTYNLVDDLPANSNDLVKYAANQIGAKNIPSVQIADLSELAQSFLTKTKIVSNQKVKSRLGYKFKYPTYVDGLNSIFANQVSKNPE